MHDPVSVDTHVHLHEVFDLERLLGAAAGVARRSGGPFMGLLTEMDGHHFFAGLRQRARGETPPDRSAGASPPRSPGRFRLVPTAEPASLSVQLPGNDAPPTYLVAGRQLVSDEGVEVLALGLDPDHPLTGAPDRTRPAAELVALVREAGAAAVLPWSFGKWVGRRGRVVEEVVAGARQTPDPLFFLGDIPARCWPWPTPGVFRGPSRVLAGTDPLPLPGCEQGVGRYRIELEGPIQPDEPWIWLRERLRSGAPFTVQGRRDHLLPTIRDQLALRMQSGR